MAAREAVGSILFLAAASPTALCAFVARPCCARLPRSAHAVLLPPLLPRQLYALTAGVAGYVSANNYRQMGGENWVRNVLLTTALYCGPLLVVFSFLNTVAIVYRSTAALPFGTIVIMTIIWALVTFPLTVLGGIAGKNATTEFYAPCRTNKYPREVPALPWYRSMVPQMCMAGFLPFSAIYIELYYIFASVWGHKVYTIYSILFIVFIILVIVTAFITIALTYFQLAVEDHHWWWRSYFCGGSTGFFVLAYCFYYFHLRSDMRGFMQTSFFFGYMFMICYGFFLMLGTVGASRSLLIRSDVSGCDTVRPRLRAAVSVEAAVCSLCRPCLLRRLVEVALWHGRMHQKRCADSGPPVPPVPDCGACAESCLRSPIKQGTGRA